MRGAAAVLTLLLLVPGAASAATARCCETVQIGTFTEPLSVTGTPRGNRLFVAEREGRIRVVRRGKVLKRPFLDIRKRVFIDPPYDQRGLLGIAVAPDYARSGRLYLLYTTHGDTVQIDEVRRSRRNPDRAARGSLRRLLNVGKARAFHHGGQLAFGPDRMLYISTGVADEPDSARALGDLHGKLLRIDPRPTGYAPYSVPRDNPFVGVPGARPEVWAYGLRNPFRFSFDRLTGDLVLGDVGDSAFEEIDFLESGTGAGADFGYPIFEGDQRVREGEVGDNYVPPVLTRPHPRFCAVVGGYVVRDRRLRGLYGRYVFADHCRSRLYTARLRPGEARGMRRLPAEIGLPVGFGEDGRGRLYVVSQRGAVLRFEPRRRR